MSTYLKSEDAIEGLKKSKESVDYGPGMANSHCGPTHKWPPGGDCQHFIRPSSCRLVRGHIGTDDWCKLWDAIE
jgi:hypothetical protein